MKYTLLDPLWEVDMQHLLIWQDRNESTFSVADEWPEPVDVTARPVITSYYFGTTVGFFYRKSDSFGYWYSSNICDLITAWRVAQILPRVKTMRNNGGGYDTTLCGLVIAMGAGDRHEKRFPERAKDLGMTVEELDAELVRLDELWPTTRELCEMWDKLPEKEQGKIVHKIRGAIIDGIIVHDNDLIGRIELCELRLRSIADQKLYEDELIKAGRNPAQSLKQFLLDIGVTNLASTVFEEFGPSHFDMDDLDREIMSRLIGEWGYYRSIPLITTAKQPDDPTAHLSAGGGGVTVYMSNFGMQGHPQVILRDEVKQLAAVSWDRVTERFQLAVRPLDTESDDEDIVMTISDLRQQIGADTQLDHPLPPGKLAAWCTVESDGKPGFLRRLFS